MVNDNIAIENAKIGFRNFSGKEGRFNPSGRRNFCVFLDDMAANKLSSDGWNIRWLEPRDAEDKKQPYLQVAVSYENMPPKIVMITSKNKTVLTAETVGLLDWAEIQEVDLIIRPYNWELSGKTGVKAYVKAMYITLVEDEFEAKYYDVPDSAMGSLEDSGH